MLRHAVAMLVMVSFSPASLADEDAPDTVEEILIQAVQASDAPGIGAVVTTREEVVDLAVVGVKRQGETTQLDTDDPFHIGSVTKPLTATVIARLVEQGLLDWDVPVADVLPDVVESGRVVYKDLTLAHLLAHEAGLKPMEEDAELAEIPKFTGDIVARRRQFAGWMFRQAPTVTPTAEYRYSNGHFVVAAAMAEAVSGKSWEQLINEHIFEPLTMTSAGFGWPKGTHAPWGHSVRDGQLRPVDPFGDYKLPQYLAPAGDVHASLPDVAQFLGRVLEAWQGQGSYLRRETLQRMLTRRIKGGLGWGVTEAFGFEPVATYSGSADTFLMVVVVIPDADIGVAVVANAFSDDIESAVVQALRGIVRLHLAEPE